MVNMVKYKYIPPCTCMAVFNRFMHKVEKKEETFVIHNYFKLSNLKWITYNLLMYIMQSTVEFILFTISRITLSWQVYFILTPLGENCDGYFHKIRLMIGHKGVSVTSL